MNILPRISLCLAVSLDGRISRGGKAAPDFTSRYDREKLFRLRAESDALMIGANTVRQEELPPIIRDETLVQERRAMGKPDHPAAVIVSSSLNLPLDSKYFKKKQQEIYLLTRNLSADERKKLDQAGAIPLETGPRVDIAEGLRQLRARGFDEVLGEGGGSLVRNLLAANLVHRLFLTVAPLIIGTDGPPLCNGPLPHPGANFTLQDHHLEGNEFHLTYVAKPG